MKYAIYFSQKGVEPLLVNEDDGKRAMAAKIDKGMFSYKGSLHDTHFITNIIAIEEKAKPLQLPVSKQKPVSMETLQKTKQDLIKRGLLGN